MRWSVSEQVHPRRESGGSARVQCIAHPAPSPRDSFFVDEVLPYLQSLLTPLPNPTVLEIGECSPSNTFCDEDIALRIAEIAVLKFAKGPRECDCDLRGVVDTHDRFARRRSFSGPEIGICESRSSR